jgi:hypothetical protein
VRTLEMQGVILPPAVQRYLPGEPVPE